MDYSVDVLDLIIVAKALSTRPGGSNWNPDADINNDGAINVLE